MTKILADLTTVVLQQIIPLVITGVVAWAGAAWAKVKKQESNSVVFQDLEIFAGIALSAAAQLAKANGWDNAAMKNYVMARLKDFLGNKLGSTFTPEQIDCLIEAVLEGVYADKKATIQQSSSKKTK